MTTIGVLLTLVLCSTVIQSTDISAEEFLKREWTENWIENAPPGFGITWMIYQDENGKVQVANISAMESTSHFDDDTDEVTFTLYTRKTAENPELLDLDTPDFLLKSALNPSHPIKIVTHGWQSMDKSETVQDIRKAYLKRGEYNVITVDWSKIAQSYNYPSAASSTQGVGKKVANLIEKILETYQENSRSSRVRRETQENQLLSRIHILGHSLGAHVAGHAGRALGDKKVGRITGLDPARPGFELYNLAPSLSKEDANFVDVIHTTAGTLGVKDSIGHVDFYPNGGYAIQPGCCCILGVIETCSHGRAHKYYAESINSDNMVAVRCDTFKDFKWGVCKGKEEAVMGEDVPLETRGVYYLYTNWEPPFALAAATAAFDTNRLLGDQRVDED